jgi:hypothetical protein
MNLDDKAFEDMSQLSQAIKFAFRRGKNWEGLPPESKEALELIASSVAQILSGAASDAKHWTDITILTRIRSKALEPPTLESSMAQIARQRTAPGALFDPPPRPAMRPLVEDDHEAS